MSTTSSTSRDDLPPGLRHLTPDQLLELDELARLKAWTRATETLGYTDRERMLIARAERESTPEHTKSIKERLSRAKLWDQLSWFLFGGPVDLVGFPITPRVAWDPETNPWIQLHVPGFAWTMDEHDEADPYKRLPDKRYLRLLAYAWCWEPHLAVPKSRQMMITWLFCAIAAHRAVFGRAQRLGFISKKEEDADKLLDRIKIVSDLMPAEYTRPEVKKKYAMLTVPESNGYIHAMGEEAKGVRSYTFSWIFFDEAAFHEQFEDTVQAALPNTDRLTLVSTPNGEEGFHDVISEGGIIPCPPGA